jgi:hypothetical protein
MTKGKKWQRRILSVFLGALLILLGLLLFTGAGKDVQNLWRNGTIQALLEPDVKRQYAADQVGNLKAIRTALLLYHDSEGQFPQANGWMDAIEPRITASDMTGSEAKKKLIRPDLAGTSNAFGYALSDKVAGKYKDDAGAKSILIYESHQTARNAHGNPEKDRQGYAVSVDGTILKP